MIFSQSQFYDIVRYAESKDLDPQIFKHEIIKSKDSKSIWGKPIKKELPKPFSKIIIENTEYYFMVELSMFDRLIGDVFLDKPSSYIEFGDRKENPNQFDIYFHVLYSPGSTHFHTIAKRAGQKKDFSWGNVFEFGKKWVDNLVDEIHAIESLSRLNVIPDFFSSHRTFDDNHDTYTGEHGALIKQKILTLKERVNEEIPMDKNQTKIINEKLDELISRIDEINKFDYRTLFFGVLTNLASSVLYDNAPQFWKIVKNIFNNTMLGGGNNGLLI